MNVSERTILRTELRQHNHSYYVLINQQLAILSSIIGRIDPFGKRKS